MELLILQKEINLKILGWVLLVILILAGIGTILYFQRTGKIGQLLGALIGKLPRKEEAAPVEEKPVEEEIEKVPAPKVYEKEAQAGEGITHLARKTLKEYLEETEMEINLTPEHKVFIEDYLQKKTGDRWLKLGEKVTFSEELIVEAINKALQLTPEQLKNLKQYSALVPSL